MPPQLSIPASRGRELYRAACAPCHGAYGDGRGAGAAGFFQPATDFTKGVYKFRSSLSKYITGEELERSIREGMSGTEMVPFKRILTGRGIARVAAYLKSFSDIYDDPAAAPGGDDRLDLPAERPFPPSPESIAAGSEVFADNCADCHGDLGEGASDETDEWERPVWMIDFRLGYFKSGNADADLYRSIVAGMPGTTMDPYSGELEPEQVWQVVDYIRSLSKEEEGLFGDLLKALFVTEPNGFDYRAY